MTIAFQAGLQEDCVVTMELSQKLNEVVSKRALSDVQRYIASQIKNLLNQSTLKVDIITSVASFSRY